MALLLSGMEIVTPVKINFKWNFHPFFLRAKAIAK